MRNPKWHRDEIILALSLYFDKNLGSIDAKNPKIIELSALLNRLPIFKNTDKRKTFRNPNGVSLKLSNFLAIDQTYNGVGMSRYSILDKSIFLEFRSDIDKLHSIALEIKKAVSNPVLYAEIAKINIEDMEITHVKEGEVLYKLHKVRERNKKIVDAKKKQVLKEQGCLKCEACDFDFEKTYGPLGIGYIECHHLVPLAKFSTIKTTKLSDLALLCSNCHKMIHRDLSINTIEGFKRRWEKLSN